MDKQDRYRDRQSHADSQRNVTRLLYGLLAVIGGAAVSIGTYQIVMQYVPSGYAEMEITVATWATAVLCGALVYLLGRGKLAIVGIVLALIVWATTAMWTATIAGIATSMTGAFLLAISIAALTVGDRAAVVMGVLSALTVVITWAAQMAGALAVIPVQVNWVTLLEVLVVQGVATALLAFSVRNGRGAMRRALAVEASLRKANAVLVEQSEALRESENRYRLLAENMSDVVFTMDLELNRTYTSRSVEKMRGFTVEQARRQTLDEILTPESYNLAMAALREELETVTQGEPCQRSRTLELEMIRADQSTVWAEVNLELLCDAEGNPKEILGVARDQTERLRNQERLREYANDLERANDEVRQFAYIVSHDLKAPLTTLAGFSRELRESLDDVSSAIEDCSDHLDTEPRQMVTAALEDDVPEALSYIESAVSQMNHFIGALLELSRAGYRELMPERLDMGALVTEVLSGLACAAAGNDVDVQVDDLPDIEADRVSMEHILSNLLSNALKYLEPSRPGRIDVRCWESDHGVSYQVRDNGRGIAEDQIGQVFLPFRRAGRQDTPGTGLGLSHVQMLVHRLGGRITCESRLDEGTAFTIRLPARAAGAADADAQPHLSGRSGQL